MDDDHHQQRPERGGGERHGHDAAGHGAMPVTLAAGVMMVLGAALLGHTLLSSEGALPQAAGGGSGSLDEVSQPSGDLTSGESDGDHDALIGDAGAVLPAQQRRELAVLTRQLSAVPAELRLAALGPFSPSTTSTAHEQARAALTRCLGDDFSQEDPPDRHPHGSGARPRYRDLGFIVPAQLDPPLRGQVQSLAGDGPACVVVQSAGGPVVLRRMVAYTAQTRHSRAAVRRLLGRRASSAVSEQAIPAAMARQGFTPPASVSSQPRATEGMAKIEGGVYWVGSTEKEITERFQYFNKYVAPHLARHNGRLQFEDEVRRPVRLAGLRLDRLEVSLGRYRRFCRESGYRGGPCAAGGQAAGAGAEDLPVVAVNLADARAFCAFYGGRLPTAHEWEAAARGKQGRRFPWGDLFPDGTRANFCDKQCDRPWATPDFDDGHAGIAPVGSFPAGATPEGILDLSGNAREWTATIQPDGKAQVKGGGHANAYDDMLPADVRANRWQARLPDVGFRCARDLSGGR